MWPKLNNAKFFNTYLCANLLPVFFLLSNLTYAQTGCTDPLANNFDPIATINNGSCMYNFTSISPVSSTQINSTLNETSGLILWDNEIWTNVDSGGPTDLFALDITDFTTFSTFNIPGVSNVDWEDMAQNQNYVYVGDFGNNVDGNRTDLKIYKIEKTSLAQGSPNVEVINFSYSDQSDFTDLPVNSTDFDCEAMIVTDSNIYLFTKEWLSQETTLYALPKTPGTHSAVNEGGYDVEGLITGATYINGEQLVVLSGYSTTLQPFLYLLYDFTGNDFFNGNKRKLGLNLPFHQVEGIASNDGINYFISNEYISNSGTTIQPKLHNLDLSNVLITYLGFNDSTFGSDFSLYPNPAIYGQFSIKTPNLNGEVNVEMTSPLGQRVYSEQLSIISNQVNVSIPHLSQGIYMVKLIQGNQFYTTKLIVE
jgi:hypothetical protein